MEAVDLDGNTINWIVKGEVVRKDIRPRSKLHVQARGLLVEKYPTIPIYEEVRIPITFGHYLYLDFFIPLCRVAVEVQGRQHYKFIKHFHGNKMAFLKQLRNDRHKSEWCEMNEIELIKLSYKEDIDEWRKKLNN